MNCGGSSYLLLFCICDASQNKKDTGQTDRHHLLYTYTSQGGLRCAGGQPVLLCVFFCGEKERERELRVDGPFTSSV